MLNEEGASEYLEAIIDSVFRIESARRPISKKDVLLFGNPTCFWMLFKRIICYFARSSPEHNHADCKQIENRSGVCPTERFCSRTLGHGCFQDWSVENRERDLGAEEIGFKDGSFECCVKKYAKDQTATIDQDSLWTLHQIEPETLIIGPFKVATVDKGAFVKDLKRNFPPT